MKEINNKTSLFYGFIGFIFSSVVQLFTIGKYIDNSIISDYSPLAVDADSYVKLATNWSSQGFSETFFDLHRTPGYPAVIYFFDFVFPSNSYFALRVFQFFAVSIAIGTLTIILSKYAKSNLLILYSFFLSLLPIWHFTPLILAESLTFFVTTIILLILQLFCISKNSVIAVVSLGILLGIMIYLKPNNIIILPLIIMLIITIKLKASIKFVGLLLIVLFAVLLPWFTHAEKSQGNFFTLSTSSGVNLYLGTGMESNRSSNVVLANSASKWRVTEEFNQLDIIEPNPNLTAQQSDDLYRKTAVDIWKKRPLQQIGFSFDKISIAFGIKSNTLFDYSFGVFNLIAILCAVFFILKDSYRIMGFGTLIMTFLLSAQAASFQADRRFIVAVFLPFASITIGLFFLKAAAFIKRYMRQLSNSSEENK